VAVNGDTRTLLGAPSMTDTAPSPSWGNPELTDCGINVGSDLGRRYELLTDRYANFYENDEVLILVSRTGVGFQDFAEGYGMTTQEFKIKMRNIAKREFEGRPDPDTNADGVELRTIKWAHYYPLVFDKRGAGGLQT